ncbi:MAG: hypothetical protein WC479_12345, partial [Candidatus Izemoplasmatales bacterium]
EVYRLQFSAIMGTRTKLQNIYSTISKTPRDKRTDHFWSTTIAKINSAWDEYRPLKQRFDELELATKLKFLSAFNKKTFTPAKGSVPPVVNKLTTNHLAYMLGVTGDDANRLLTDVTSQIIVRPKEDFTSFVYVRAKDYAENKMASTAEQLGWSKDNIRQLYDDMWKNNGIDPGQLEIDKPAMMELDNIFKELKNQQAITKFSESDTAKFKDWINSIADDLEQTSMYKPVEAKPLVDILDFEGESTLDARVELQNRLTELATNVQVPGDGTLRSQVDKWFHQTDNDALQNIGKAAKSNQGYLDEIHKILKEKYPSGKIRIFRGSGAAKTSNLDPLNREFTNVTSDKAVAKDFENTWDTAPSVDWWRDKQGIDSKLGHWYYVGTDKEVELDEVERIVREWQKTQPVSVNDIVINVEDVVSIGSITESELIIPSEVLKSRIADKLSVPRGAAYPDWMATKTDAMSTALEQHSLAYPTYTDANVIDETMRNIFPFWTYETFRYKWLPRTFMRTPGTLTALARYMGYSDGGYVPIPGTDLQVNPLRGSIWMGGLRSLYLKDFPEYYDQFPGLEMFESISRLGFYPGLPIQIPSILFGQVSGKPQWSELAPPFVSAPLYSLRALSPDHLGKVIDIIMPERFHDYKVMMKLAQWGYNADDIWKKKAAGQTLTPEEEKLWNKASGDGLLAFQDILMEQTGLFRYKPQEYETMKREFKLAIQDMTGVSVATQEEIDRQYPVTGKRFMDYYPLDVYQQKVLYSYESFRQWQGVSTPLYPASWQPMEVKISQYYDDLERIENDFRHKGLFEDDKRISYSIEDLNSQLISGSISPKQWVSGRNEAVSDMSTYISSLRQSNAYKDIPLTYEERTEYIKSKGSVVPFLTPDQELLYFYYELKPEMKFNPETGIEELDFDTYYAYVDNLLRSMDEPFRNRLLQRIQSDWTGMEKLYWQISKDYFKPYNNV